MTTEGLTMMETEVLRRARELIERKPEAVLAAVKRAPKNETFERAMIALALSAQLNASKQSLQTMKVSLALAQFFKDKKGEEVPDER